LTVGLGGNFLQERSMELRQQLERWNEQVADAGADAAADMDVTKRLLKHGIEATTEIASLRTLLRDIKAWDVNQYMTIPHELRVRIEAALPPNEIINGRAEGTSQRGTSDVE